MTLWYYALLLTGATAEQPYGDLHRPPTRLMGRIAVVSMPRQGVRLIGSSRPTVASMPRQRVQVLSPSRQEIHKL